jgi:hypothetical protein
MHATRSIAVALIVAGATGAGCTRREQPKLPGDDKVLAVVNDSAITQYDLERAIRDVLGAQMSSRLDEAARKRMLESLVQSRAIAHARDKELSVDERAELEKKVAAYREELLVKQYLVKHTPPGGVSDEMVREYYAQHKERFGARTLRSYELLTSAGALSAAQRTQVIAALGKAEREDEWQALSERLQKSGLAVALRRGQDDETVLHPKLRQLIARLSVGEASDLTFIEGLPYAVRVTAERETAARPLAEVSDEIRKTLAPIKLKQSVKQASERVIKHAEVAYR